LTFRRRHQFPVLLLATALAACGGDSSGPGRGPGPDPLTTELRPLTPAVRVGEVARLVSPRGGLGTAARTGTLGSVAATFGVVDDSTLAVIIPAAVTPGPVAVRVDLGGGNAGEATLTVSAGAGVGNPITVVNSALDGAASVVRVPRPADYGAGWSADSALVEEAVAEARAAAGQLDYGELLEMARLFGAHAVPSAASAPAADVTQDAACAQKLVGWEEDLGAGESAAGAAAALRSDAVRWALAKAFALTTYIKAVLTHGQVGVLCTMEQNFDVADQPTADRTGSEVRVTADHRTFVDADAVANFMARRAQTARRRLTTLVGFVRGLFGGESSVSAPAGPQQGAVVRQDAEVEGERVSLQTGSITAPDGSSVPITLIRSGGAVIVRATSTLRTAVRRALTFTITRPDFAPQQVTAEVTVQAVCIEEGQIFPGCVDRVEVTPATMTVGVNGTHQLTARALDTNGVELAREVTWETSDASIAVVGPQSGIVRGEREGGPVTITARVGRGEHARAGTATVTVIAEDSTAIYAQAVQGRWTATNLESGEPNTLEVRADGRGAYIVAPDDLGYCRGLGGTRVGEHCEYAVTWQIVRANGRYHLYESGFWHPAFDGLSRDPLTMPVTGFTTYNGNGTPAVRYVKQ